MVAVAVGQSVCNLISTRLLEELLLQFVNLIVILFVITGNALRKYIKQSSLFTKLDAKTTVQFLNV